MDGPARQVISRPWLTGLNLDARVWTVAPRNRLNPVSVTCDVLIHRATLRPLLLQHVENEVRLFITCLRNNVNEEPRPASFRVPVDTPVLLDHVLSLILATFAADPPVSLDVAIAEIHRCFALMDGTVREASAARRHDRTFPLLPVSPPQEEEKKKEEEKEEKKEEKKKEEEKEEKKEEEKEEEEDEEEDEELLQVISLEKEQAPTRKRKREDDTVQLLGGTPTCCICMDKPADTIALPCMHRTVCRNCSQLLENSRDAKTCVQCRCPVESIIEDDALEVSAAERQRSAKRPRTEEHDDD